MSEEKKKGCFTLPGEAGYEKLTLEMAEKWGADVIRDSDGTVLSDEILDAGFTAVAGSVRELSELLLG